MSRLLYPIIYKKKNPFYYKQKILLYERGCGCRKIRNDYGILETDNEEKYRNLAPLRTFNFCAFSYAQHILIFK